MKKIIAACCFCLMVAPAFCQDINAQLKEASNLERQLKDADALAKYKEVLTAAPNNMAALAECTEINCNIGERANKGDKHVYYSAAYNYAQLAFNTDSTAAEANYLMALATDKLIELETSFKKILELEKQVKMYADKALAANAAHARANYMEGKWNYDIVTLPPVKLTEAKAFHKGFGDVDIDSAITYMEKCRVAEQYFAQNYLLLAKAYRFKKRPAQAIEVLSKLVKLPTRTPNDITIKAEGQQLLGEMQ